MNDNRTKVKESKAKPKYPVKYSPKFPLKKGIASLANSKKYDKRLIGAHMKNRQNYDNQVVPNMNGAYSLIDPNWQPNHIVDKSRTHDERNSEKIHLEPSTSIVNTGDDYATYTMYKENGSKRGSKQLLNYMNPGCYSSQPHSKPVVDSNVAVQRYVKMVPNKTIHKKHIKQKSSKTKSNVKNYSLNKSNDNAGKMIISPHQISKLLNSEHNLNFS